VRVEGQVAVIDTLVLVRGAHLAATTVAAGTVAFMVLVAEPAFRLTIGLAASEFAVVRRRWNGLVLVALATVVASGVVWLVLLAADILGASILQVCLQGGVWTVLSETRFGLVWIVRLALALLLAVLLLWPEQRLARLLAAASLIGTLAFIGHAGASLGTAGSAILAADMAHLLGAGVWVGSLPALVVLLERTRRVHSAAWRNLTSEAAYRFYPLGMIAVGTLLATGIVNCWQLLGEPQNLIVTDYGRLLLLKIGLFIAMVGIAAVNRLHLTPRLTASRAMHALERNVITEIGLGLCVLAIVGALGTMAPPAHDQHLHTADTEIPADAAFGHIHAEQGRADMPPALHGEDRKAALPGAAAVISFVLPKRPGFER
jgi:copper resistance protein D